MTKAFDAIFADLTDNTILKDNWPCLTQDEKRLVKVMRSNGGGGGGSGNVTAASNFGADNRIIRSDGTTKGVQPSAWSIADTGEASVTIDGSEEEGLNITATGADALGLVSTASGLGGIGVYGGNTTAAGIGVEGVSNVSGGVGVLAWSNHVSATALAVKNVGGFSSNIGTLATSNLVQNLPNVAGTLLIGSVTDNGDGSLTFVINGTSYNVIKSTPE